MKKIGPDQFTTWWSPYNKPAVYVDSGESVQITVRDTYQDLMTDADSRRLKELAGAPVNPVNQPIYVNDAMPGDTIKVTIERITPTSDATFIMDHPGVCEGFREFITDYTTIKVPINAEEGYADMYGNRIPLRPLLGCIGIAPKTNISTFDQGDFCGNIDCKEVIAGNILYLPVQVPGGLVSTGDIHAGQGDGEIVSGLEVSGEVVLKLELIKGVSEKWPVLESPDRWYTIVSLPSMFDAAQTACKEAAKFIMARSDRYEPYQMLTLLSICGDVQVNEMVDPVVSMRYGFDKNLFPNLTFEGKKRDYHQYY